MTRCSTALGWRSHRGAPLGSLAAGARVGAYRILNLIGRGGMGEVYRAERADRQYQQLVALKLVTADALLRRNASLFDSNGAANTNQNLPISLQEQSKVSIAEGRYDDAANQLQRASRLWTEGFEKRAHPGGERLLLLTEVALLRGGQPAAAAQALQSIMATWTPLGADVSTAYLSAVIGVVELLLERGDVTSAHDVAVAFQAHIRAAPEHQFLADLERVAGASVNVPGIG